MASAHDFEDELRRQADLTGEFVELRPVEVTDAVWMLAADPETIRLTGTHSSAEFFTLESLENWYATRAEHDDRLDLSIIERATGEWAGEVVLNELEVYDFNPRARHVYEKAGFVHEGTKRDALQWDGNGLTATAWRCSG